MKTYLGREIEVLDKLDLSGNLVKIRLKDTGEIKNIHTNYIKLGGNNMEIVKKGTKVVPFKKSYGALDDCFYWEEAKSGQGYLYVTGTAKDTNGTEYYVLNIRNPKEEEELGGNFYLREDFNLYTEKEESKAEEVVEDITLDNLKNIDIKNEDCDNFTLEIITRLESRFKKGLKNKESIALISISDVSYDYDPHFNLEQLKILHKWAGDIIKVSEKFLEEEELPKEMTIEEIEKELGFKIVIKN